MRKLWVLAVLLPSFLVAACNKNGNGNENDNGSPTAPSQNEEQKLEYAVLNYKRPTIAESVFLWIYGSVNKVLERPEDLNGGNIRLRERSCNDVTYTYVTDWANSEPIQGTNTTLHRDIPTCGRIKQLLIFMPYEGADPSRWSWFTFPNSKDYELLPKNLNIVPGSGKEMWITGDLPPVSNSLTAMSSEALPSDARVVSWNLTEVSDNGLVLCNTEESCRSLDRRLR